MKLNSAVILLLMLGMLSCGDEQEKISPTTGTSGIESELDLILLFKSGFDEGTIAELEVTQTRAKDITGKDMVSGYDWETDLEGNKRDFFMNYVDGTNGNDPEMLGVLIDKDPDDPNNNVLYSWQNDSEWQDGGYWSRVQARMNNCDFSEVLCKFRIRFDEDIAVLNNTDWWTWFSIYSINPLQDDDFSLSVRLNKEDKDVLKWGVYRKNKTEGPTHYRSEVPVNFDKWTQVEFYTKAGDDDKGRLALYVDGQLLFDEIAATSYPNDVWENIRLLKVYGNIMDIITDPEYGNKPAVKVWFDDLEIWVNQ